MTSDVQKPPQQIYDETVEELVARGRPPHMTELEYLTWFREQEKLAEAALRAASPPVKKDDWDDDPLNPINENSYFSDKK